MINDVNTVLTCRVKMNVLHELILEDILDNFLVRCSLPVLLESVVNQNEETL
jgi:hypothetical protein